MTVFTAGTTVTFHVTGELCVPMRNGYANARGIRLKRGRISYLN